jgi:hypothetical protein
MSEDRELLMFGFPMSHLVLGMSAGDVGAIGAALNKGGCPRVPTHVKMMICRM